VVVEAAVAVQQTVELVARAVVATITALVVLALLGKETPEVVQEPVRPLTVAAVAALVLVVAQHLKVVAIQMAALVFPIHYLALPLLTAVAVVAVQKAERADQQVLVAQAVVVLVAIVAQALLELQIGAGVVVVQEATLAVVALMLVAQVARVLLLSVIKTQHSVARAVLSLLTRLTV
jgi:hypothetical protein